MISSTRANQKVDMKTQLDDQSKLVVYDIESQRLCVCLNMLHIFTCLKFVCKNSALSDDSTCSKCISAYFYICTSYDHILNTLNIDAFCSSSHRTVWSLCWSHDILSHWLVSESCLDESINESQNWIVLDL